MKPTHWRHSLYSRALLLTLIGGGCLIGAVVVQSQIMVSTSVDRLLKDRIELARITGAHLEHVIEDGLERVVRSTQNILSQPENSGFLANLNRQLESVQLVSLFGDGLFALDGQARMITAVIPELVRLPEVLDLGAIAKRSSREKRSVISPLITLVSGRKVVVALTSVWGSRRNLLGFVGGAFSPSQTNLLEWSKGAGQGQTTSMQLVDDEGNVIAATQSDQLLTQGDHGHVLTKAIHLRQVVQGRCHSCHREVEPNKSNEKKKKEDLILAFAPLPNLNLGVAVRELESEVLAPAFGLQGRLIFLGFSFVALFLIFSGLSVYAVVSPVTRLTRAVREVDENRLQKSLPTFGRDELGELRGALERWRCQVLSSMSVADKKNQDLVNEMSVNQRHLAALQVIAEFGMGDCSLEEIAQNGLEQLTGFLRLQTGVLRLSHSRGVFSVSVGSLPCSPDCLLDRVGKILPATEGSGLQIQIFDKAETDLFPCVDSGGVAAAANAVISHGIQASCVLLQRESSALVEERHLRSFLHQILMSASNRLLVEESQGRHEQSREYLQRVLAAQEEERKRIARELHDTIAQDLAAHRLDLERFAKLITPLEPSDDQLKHFLVRLEKQAQGILVDLRNTLVDLRPSVLDTMGFLPALRWHLDRIQRESGLKTNLSVDGEVWQLEADSLLTLFRIFQECINNVLIHAEAEHIMVSLTYKNTEVVLEVEDDGKGFIYEEVLNRTDVGSDHGLGLLGIQERALLVGGTAKIESEINKGTLISVSIPRNVRRHHV